MQITDVSLENFRNLSPLHLQPAAGINVLYGENAQGKTNFLESLYFCAMGRSLRGRNEQQLISFDCQESHIRLETKGRYRSDRIDVHLKRDEKKGIAINGVPIRKMGELFGTLYAVIFSPEDLSLVKGGPGERRRYLDMELCQLSPVYYDDLQAYYRVLKQRNHLLKEMRKNPRLLDTLSVWDIQLAERGERLMAARERFLARIDVVASQKHEILTGGKDRLKMAYKPNCEGGLLAERLERNRERDMLLGSTSFGPHKDEILFLVNDKDVKQFGSQGQQRTTALSARLAEISLIQDETGENPVLLLDDVLSELDEHRQKYLMESIEGMQAFLTCTGIEDAVKGYVAKDNLFRVENGVVRH